MTENRKGAEMCDIEDLHHQIRELRDEKTYLRMALSDLLDLALFADRMDGGGWQPDAVIRASKALGRS